MNKFILIFLILTSNYSFTQNINVGIEVSPSFQLQSIRNKSTGLFSSINGYGFNVGMPIQFELEDSKSFTTGINYEFSAYDNRNQSYLISSLRLNSIHIPLTYNLPIIEGFYLNPGIGVNYIFSSKQYGSGVWLNTNPIVNQIQPYIALGLSTLIDLGNNTYELGINSRYHLIDIWKNTNQTTTKIIGIDLNMKYYF